MKTGMSKFTKGCLLTALVTFVLGCLLCGIGALFGGFRQLNTAAANEVGLLKELPVRVVVSENGGIQFGVFSHDNRFNWSAYDKWNRINNSEDAVALDLTADTLRHLEMEIGTCDLRIMDSPDEHVRLGMSGNTGGLRYLVDGDTLRMVHASENISWKWGKTHWTSPEGQIVLYLPEGTYFNSVDMEVASGNVEVDRLQAHEMNLEVGLGNWQMGSMESDGIIVLSVGAGQVEIDSLRAKQVDLEIGAGQLTADQVQITKYADIEIGMGSVDLTGVITGNLNAECGMGNLTMQMEDAETDHNYELECAMGNMVVGSWDYSGVANERSVNNGGNSTYDIECAMGSVTVTFAE